MFKFSHKSFRLFLLLWRLYSDWDDLYQVFKNHYKNHWAICNKDLQRLDSGDKRTNGNRSNCWDLRQNRDREQELKSSEFITWLLTVYLENSLQHKGFKTHTGALLPSNKFKVKMWHVINVSFLIQLWEYQIYGNTERWKYKELWFISTRLLWERQGQPRGSSSSPEGFCET